MDDYLLKVKEKDNKKFQEYQKAWEHYKVYGVEKRDY